MASAPPEPGHGVGFLLYTALQEATINRQALSVTENLLCFLGKASDAG